MNEDMMSMVYETVTDIKFMVLVPILVGWCVVWKVELSEILRNLT